MDIATIISLLSNGASVISSATNSAKSLTDILSKKNKEMPMEAQSAIASLLDQLIKANTYILETQQAVAELKRKSDEVDRFAVRSSSYRMVLTPMGGLVYEYVATEGERTPPHYCCPQCFAKQELHLLQPFGCHLMCVNCKVKYQNTQPPSPGVVPRRRGVW